MPYTMVGSGRTREAVRHCRVYTDRATVTHVAIATHAGNHGDAHAHLGAFLNTRCAVHGAQRCTSQDRSANLGSPGPFWRATVWRAEPRSKLQYHIWGIDDGPPRSLAFLRLKYFIIRGLDTAS